MAWASAKDFSFTDGRYSLKWPDGTILASVITMIDEKPYVTFSIMGVSFYADAVANNFSVEVADTPPPENPDEEHQIEDEEDPPPPADSPFAPVEPLPGPPLAPGEEVVPLAK